MFRIYSKTNEGSISLQVTWEGLCVRSVWELQCTTERVSDSQQRELEATACLSKSFPALILRD